MLVGITFCIIGFGMLISAIVMLRKSIITSKGRIANADGLVTFATRLTKYVNDEQENVYHVRVTFNDQDGNEHTFNEELPAEESKKFNVGEIHIVTYDPNDPDNNVSLQDSPIDLRQYLALGLGGTAFAVIGVIQTVLNTTG